VVLLGNIIGTGIAAWAFEYMPIFDEETRDAFVKIGMDVMKNTPLEMFSNAIISGWIIATMVWMFPSAGSAKIVVIILMTWLIALGDTTHIVVGTVEILYLVFNGTLHWSDFFWPFALPTLAGNICGGTFIFALLSHAQIRNDMSNKRKAEAKAREEAEQKNREKAKKTTQDLREHFHSAAQIMQRHVVANHRRHHLQTCHDAITRGRFVQQDHVTGVFSTNAPALLLQFLQHVAVAHFRTNKRVKRWPTWHTAWSVSTASWSRLRSSVK
jgi:hypothetical protein